MVHSIHELAEDIRRQVKKHREKRRKRQTTRKLMQRQRGSDGLAATRPHRCAS